ncbi:uncharacterized protein TNCV_4170761 [Trichonephila clavipes]|nr:uncharacterized protein TNCV_4170761 [Trichonephila clavipes]
MQLRIADIITVSSQKDAEGQFGDSIPNCRATPRGLRPLMLFFLLPRSANDLPLFRIPELDVCQEARRGLLVTDNVILNHGQVTWMTPERAPPLLTTTPHQREDVSTLDRFSVHRCTTRRVSSGTGLELMTCLP